MNTGFIAVSRPLSLVFTLLIGVCVSASAIELSRDHSGQYLIVPFALATDHYDTLLQVNNSMDKFSPRALKLRILDRDGIPALTGNLYLRAGETWAGGLTLREDGARLVSSSEACLLIDSDDGVVPSTAAAAVDFEAGFIEWVEMGVVADQEYRELIHERDCDGLVALWSDPDWAWNANAVLDPPAGGLKATASLINVDRGTMYALTATALEDFSTIVQHTDPSSSEPNLSTTFDEGTLNGETRSTVCHRGDCVTDTWASPVDAASAALIVREVRGDFVISESIGAATEWVVTYPTRAYYPDGHSLTWSFNSLFLADRSGHFLGTAIDIVPPLPGFYDQTYGFVHEQSINHLDFNKTKEQVGLQLPSSVFGTEHPVLFPSDPGKHHVIPDSGQARMGFTANNPSLASNDGTPYLGRSAIVWIFQEFENGTLESSDGTIQRANYGNAFEASMFPFQEEM